MEYLTIGFCRWIVDTWFDYIQVLIVIGSVTPSGVDVRKSGDGLGVKFKFEFKSSSSASTGCSRGYGESGRVLTIEFDGWIV